MGSMLTKQQLIGIAVAMVESNQLSAMKVRGFPSSEMCMHGDIPLFRRMVEIIKEFYDGFDYAKTPEHLKSLEGKSDAFRKMKVKLLTSERRSAMLKRFSDSLASILESREAYDLVTPEKHDRLRELQMLLLEISNPSGDPIVSQ